jgi:hemerythrin
MKHESDTGWKTPDPRPAAELVITDSLNTNEMRRYFMDSNNFLQWRSEYSVGIPEIDKQHQEIMALITDLLKLCREDNNDGKQQSFADLVAIITEHLQKHFEAEENLMLENNYPHYENHKKRHDQLLENVKKMMEKILNGKHRSLLNMVIFLREWFVENIYGLDKDLGDYLNGRESDKLV